MNAKREGKYLKINKQPYLKQALKIAPLISFGPTSGFGPGSDSKPLSCCHTFRSLSLMNPSS